MLAEVFSDEVMAWQRGGELRAEMRPDNDEVGVFCSQVIPKENK